jgi:fibronectin type 3 domain-containing protein
MMKLEPLRTRGAWLLTIAFLGTLLSACGTTPNSSEDGGSSPHTVSLIWNTSTSSNVVGYNIYRGTTSGNYALLKSMNSNTSYLDASVQSGQTYYYVVTAVDAAGAESPYSNKAEAVIP